MKNLNSLSAYRLKGAEIRNLFGSDGNENCGAFGVVSSVDSAVLFIVASCHAGWEHVSVSRAERCPSWQEMQQVHRLFFKPGEFAMQLYGESPEAVEALKHCLHLWRPCAEGLALPLPPRALSGSRG